MSFEGVPRVGALVVLAAASPDGAELPRRRVSHPSRVPAAGWTARAIAAVRAMAYERKSSRIVIAGLCSARGTKLREAFAESVRRTEA